MDDYDALDLAQQVLEMTETVNMVISALNNAIEETGTKITLYHEDARSIVTTLESLLGAVHTLYEFHAYIGDKVEEYSPE